MDIGSLAGSYLNGIGSSNIEKSDKTASKIEGLNASSLKNSSDDELMSVCKEFESYFLEQIFKEMKKTIPENEDMSSSSKSLTDYFGDELIREYSAQSTQRDGLGLAQMLYEQMKRNMSV